MIGNLLSNARSHGHLGEPIIVTLSEQGGAAVFEVSNVADPIDDATVRSLYTPFKQASLDNPRNRGGMGLGLYIADRIIAEHGGRIVYSYADRRVTFTVTIPLAG